MTQRTPREQLVKYLTDVHSIELQALAQLKTAPEIAGDPELSQAFSTHLAETEEQERLITDRLAALGAQPAKVKDLVGTLTGKGFVAFARSQPDTPGKLTAHAFSYEHMEVAAYEFLRRVADRAGDAATAQVARRILVQEEEMGERLGDSFGKAVDAALEEVSPSNLGDQLDSYLADAPDIAAQAIPPPG